jgi:CHAT domain-containing protein/tetratricopeptide (TPR) repeat protein
MYWRTVSSLVLVCIMSMVTGTSAFQETPLDAALRLQRDGRDREARQALRALLPDLRASSDRAALARALAAATDASIALGDYESAIQEAREAFDVHQRLGRQTYAAWDLNAIGLANLYLGRYDEALANYQRALALDRASGDGDGEITRLNNVGNVHYLRGRYTDALRAYEDALAAVHTRTTEGSRARLRKMTIANLAALHQRLGADQRALDLYAQIAGEKMQPSEEAQMLINQGALLRRLGDPIKAMQTYRQAQAIFARERHRDGEIGAWRNIGIACALDLNDNPRALDAFGAALRLAQESSNQRGEVQARLYRGETLRRMGRLGDAARELRTALDGAARIGLVEEQWKALFSLGRVSEAEGRSRDARQSYEQAVHAIESVRADLRTVALRSEFLADKRDVYDALIALRLSDPTASPGDLFELIERSRARTWQDRLQPMDRPLTLSDVQPRIPADALLLEYWSAANASAMLWASRSAAGIFKQAGSADEATRLQRMTDAVSSAGEDWRAASVEAGRILLSGLPDDTVLRGVTGLLVVPDGSLAAIPFEALTLPGSRNLLIERFEISYLPSAGFLVRRSAQTSRPWKWPWQRELVAFGDPPAMSGDPLGAAGGPARLSYARDEIRSIAQALPGRAELHLGTDALKRFVVEDRPRAPLLHFSTHAIADTRDPDRSRILLAPAAPDGPADYLFLREIYDVNLTGVQLVTLSACDTERGKVIRGEGVEGFSRALLAAGSASAITTMWDVADRAGAEFMKQFYFALAQGESEASALRHAKLRFLQSPLAWSHPRYWAGYVLNGNGGARLPRVVPWGAVAGGLLVILVAVAILALRLRRAASA